MERMERGAVLEVTNNDRAVSSRLQLASKIVEDTCECSKKNAIVLDISEIPNIA